MEREELSLIEKTKVKLSPKTLQIIKKKQKENTYFGPICGWKQRFEQFKQKGSVVALDKDGIYHY